MPFAAVSRAQWVEMTDKFLESIVIDSMTTLISRGSISEGGNYHELVDIEGNRPIILRAYSPQIIKLEKRRISLDSFPEDEDGKKRLRNLIIGEVKKYSDCADRSANAFHLSHLEIMRDVWTGKYDIYGCVVSYFQTQNRRLDKGRDK